MTTARRTITGFICAALLATASTDAWAISLREAVQRAVTEHPQVGAARERLTANEYAYDGSRARLGPTVDLDADAGKQYIDRPNGLSDANNDRWWFRRQATLSARFVLFDGWDRANAIYRDAARVDAATMSVMENAESIALEVVEAYIDYRRHRFLLQLADENIADHKSILGLTRNRLSGGSGTQSEVEQVEERLAGAKAVRAEVLQAALETEAKFRSAVGADPGQTHKVGFPRDMPRSRSAAVDLAIAGNPSIAVREAEVQAFDFEKERAKSEYYPTLALEGSAQAGHDLNAVPGKNDDLSVKLRLSWRLYDHGVRNAKVGEASALASEARLKRDLQVRKITEAIESTWGKMTASAERLAAIEAQISSARKVEASYRREFEAGKRSLLDLLDAQSAVFSSRFESTSVAGVQLFSAYYIKALTGSLLAALDVAAPAAGYERAPSYIGKAPPRIKIEPLK